MNHSQPTFGLDRVEALQAEFAGYPLWQYLASLAWVALAFLLAAIIDFVMTHQLRKLAAKPGPTSTISFWKSRARP